MSIAGNSRSATVKAANSKIAVMLRKREEDDALLTIGKRKTRDVAKNEIKIRPGKKGKTAWEQPADFSFPTPLVDRPRTADGAQSFHFSYTTISKTGVPTQKGEPIAGLPSSSIQPALDHSKYIEREGAAELSAGAEHAGYIERPGAVEMTDPTGEAAEAVERDIALLAGEGLSDDEATHVGPLDEMRKGIPSVFSNISDDPFEREEYWRAVYRSERTPDIHFIQLDMESSPRWWANLDADSDLDPSFKSHVLQVKEAYQRYLRNHVSEVLPKPFDAEPYPASSERAGTILKQAAKLPGYSPSDAPTVFKSGRGGRAQIRFVAELPHELTPEDRALIVQNFTDHLGSFSTDKDGKPVGLMYTAVIHAPDIHNDARNYHLHIVAHDRPARFLDGEGQWDFEVAVDYIDPGSRKIRTHTPFRQNKIGDVSRRPVGEPLKPGAGRDFIPTVRAEFARVTNLVLEARGLEKRYDPRSYTDMGIDRDPTEHLGTKAAALEAAGVPTTIGKLNAIKIWRDAENSIEKNAAAADAVYLKKQKELADLAAAVTAVEPRDQALVLLRQLAAERQELIDGLAEDRRLVQTFDHLEAKAKSRAVRTRQTCLAYLTDITAGTARPGTARLRPQIQERFRVAQAHIAKVDNLLAGDRVNIATMSRSILEREARVDAVDRTLEPLLASLRVAAQAKPARPLPPIQIPIQIPRVEPPLVDVIKLPVPPVVVAERTDQPAPPQPVVIVATPTPEKEISHGRAFTQALLASVGRYQLALHERDLEDAPPRASAGTLSSLRHLSRIGMVHHQKIFAVFLQRDAGDDLGRGRDAGDELRRTGTGDRETQQGIGGTAAVTSPDPKIVELSPAAIEGAPIVAPSLPPRAKIDIGNEPTQPGGLEPLRAPPTKDEAPVVPETIIADLSATDAENRASAAASQPNPTPVVETPDAAKTPGVQATEPKIDGRRRVEVPTLFDLPEQLPPIKPGTPQHAYQDWDKLLNRIAEDRVPIAEERNNKGDKTYTVPAISAQERALLNDVRFSHRTNNRLGSIYEKQQLEIKRMVRWISTQGNDPTLLIIEGRSAKLGNAPKSVKTLMRHWKTNETVRAAVRTENDRRIIEAEAAKNRIEDELPMPSVPGLETITDEQRRMRAELVYPDPRYVDTKDVAEFTKALRTGTTPIDELERLAARVQKNFAARDDVMRHTPEFAEAYAYHAKGAVKRDAEQARIQASDKSNGRGR